MDTAVKRMSISCALQRVFEWIWGNKLLLWMLMNRRFYLEFLPAILHPLCVFLRRGFRLIENSASIQVFSQTSL